MKREELMRLATATEGVDLVVEVEGDGREGEVWLVHDHHANGTSERAELDLQDMLKLRATLGTLIRSRQKPRLRVVKP